MNDQQFMVEDLVATKAMLQTQLDSQKSYLESIDLQVSEEPDTPSHKEMLMNASYIAFLESIFTLLIVVGLIFSIITGGVCAYCCNRKFCRTEAGSNAPTREAHTIDMQVVTGNSPPASPELRLPGQGQQPKFGLSMKRMEAE